MAGTSLETDTVYGGRVYCPVKPGTQNERAPEGKAFTTNGELVDLPPGLLGEGGEPEPAEAEGEAQAGDPLDVKIPPYFPKLETLGNEENGITTFRELKDAMGEGDVEERSETLAENVKGIGEATAPDVILAFDETDFG